MAGPYEAVKVSEHVYWVGAIDWGIRDFHGYTTLRGSTYNAYLVTGDDVILIDTVKAPFKDELLSRVASVVDPGDIRYIISNHAEMDHSGSLPAVVDEVKPEQVYASVMGVKALGEHFHMDRGINGLSDGDTLELGGLDFTFLETRMLHWPDSMVTYLPSDRLLFSQDGFGMHLATAERFADEIPESLLLEEGSKYFANILLPYSALITKFLERVRDLGIELDIIAPDHGPIWRRDLEAILGLYGRWAEQAPTNKAVIVYDTMWGSTEKMARATSEGIIGGGGTVALCPLKSVERSEVMTDLLEAGALVVGTPTINNGMFPSVADVLTYAKGLKPKNLVGAVFGSYGWSGEGVKRVVDILSDMKVELVAEPMNTKYVPDENALAACRALGAAVASKLEELV